MRKGYLLDVNHVSAMFSKNAAMVQKISSRPEGTLLLTCAITLGEIAAGNSITNSTNQNRRDEYTAFINGEFLPLSLALSHSTAYHYAEIIKCIWQMYPPSKSSKKTEQHLVELGVDVNDIWLNAVALEHGLILLTQDKMTCIRKAVPRIKAECWIAVAE